MPHISIRTIQYVHTNYQRLCGIVNTSLLAIAFVKFMIYKFYIFDLYDTNCSFYTEHWSTLVKKKFISLHSFNLYSSLQYWCVWGFIYFKIKYTGQKQLKAIKQSWKSSSYSVDDIVRKIRVSVILW